MAPATIVASGWRAASAASPSSEGGGGEERVLVADEEVARVDAAAALASAPPGVREGGEPASGLGRPLRVRVVRHAGAAGEGRVRDWAIAGAAAEVSGEPVVHGGAIRRTPAW